MNFPARPKGPQGAITDILLDRAIANREGELISAGEYDTSWIVKNWPSGRECDTRNEEELLKSMRLLARIHRTARGIHNLSQKETKIIHLHIYLAPSEIHCRHLLPADKNIVMYVLAMANMPFRVAEGDFVGTSVDFWG